MIQKLVNELKRLTEAKDLLDRVWTEIDVYSGRPNLTQDGSIRPELLRDLRSHFKFDDSE